VCKRAKRYLKENNIPFQEYDVENSEKGKTDFANLNGRGVPNLLVGEKRMNGFSEKKFEKLYAKK
jgi:glutaredoxin